MIDFQFVLDANIFMEASRRYYAFEFGTKFWDFIIEKFNEKILCSIDKVLDEIKLGKENDPLREWSEKHEYLFLSTDKQLVLEKYALIINWAENNPQYKRIAKDEFMEADNADTWLIAFAYTYNLTIVTHEVYNPEIKRKIPIPNVCKAFNIPYLTTFELLKLLNFKL